MRKQLIKRPRKRLGQNFLNDKGIFEAIADEAMITKSDTVVEVGPGYGGLTEVLLERAGRVIAVELDDGLYSRLQKEFAGCSNLELVNCDILAYPFDEIDGYFKVVANPPYYLSTPLLYTLIEKRSNISSLVLTLQKEVAQRVVATPSTKSYGSLTVFYNLFADSNIAFEIGREKFYPVPAVDSAVLRVEFLNEPAVRVGNLDSFFTTVRAAFSHRRKTLANSLKKSGKLTGEYLLADKLDEIGIDPKRRAETLSLEEFVTMGDALNL